MASTAGIQVVDWAETARSGAEIMRFPTNRGGESGARPGADGVPGSSRSPGGPVPVAAGTGTEVGRKLSAKPQGIDVGAPAQRGATHVRSAATRG